MIKKEKLYMDSPKLFKWLHDTLSNIFGIEYHPE